MVGGGSGGYNVKKYIMYIKNIYLSKLFGIFNTYVAQLQPLIYLERFDLMFREFVCFESFLRMIVRSERFNTPVAG